MVEVTPARLRHIIFSDSTARRKEKQRFCKVKMETVKERHKKFLIACSNQKLRIQFHAGAVDGTTEKFLVNMI
jgi:hypothetical protein